MNLVGGKPLNGEFDGRLPVHGATINTYMPSVHLATCVELGYCRFDRWSYANPKAGWWFFGLGAALLALGVWLIVKIPAFGRSIYGNGSESVPYYLAYGQSAFAALLGISFLTLGSLAARQHRIHSSTDGTWHTARKGLRVLAVMFAGIGALAILVGLAVVIPDPSSVDYWSFGLPVALMAGTFAGVLWRTSSDAIERPKPPTWSPPAR